MAKSGPVPSPFSTGQGGARFEWLVGASYLVSLLAGESARGFLQVANTVVEVRFQQRSREHQVDDIVIVATTGTAQGKLALQVKHRVTFTANVLFCEIVRACWEEFNSRTFVKERDAVGIALSEVCNVDKIRTHCQDLLLWARTSSKAAAFYERVSKFKAKQSLLETFHEALGKSLAKPPTNYEVWQFLRHFVVIPFDFDSTSSRDAKDCWDKLQSLYPKREAKLAMPLFKGMYELVSLHAATGGDLDLETLMCKLGDVLPLGSLASMRSIRTSLTNQVMKQLSREKRSKKYIPEVFTEIHTVKDSVRFFAHPVLFFQKALERFLRMDFSFVNSLVLKFGLPAIVADLPGGLRGTSHLSTIPWRFEILQEQIQKVSNALAVYGDRSRYEELSEKVPQEAADFFKESKWLLENATVGFYGISELRRDLLLGRSRVIILTSRAGQGKTNFVCDFAENFLLRRRIPCMLVTGRELRNAPAGMLEAYLVKLAMGRDFVGNVQDFLRLVGEICGADDVPFTIIFDGINEHPEIARFAIELENLVETLLQSPFVKIVLTCRSEYYKERFGNLNEASFASEVYHFPEIHQKMSPQLREHMERAYFKFFRISPDSISKTASKALRSDPLLLRFFCEAYEQPNSQEVVRLPCLLDIYRPAIFKLYMERKLDEVAARNKSSTGIEIGSKQPYEDLLSEVVVMMLSRRQFGDVPIADLKNHHGPLGDLVDEDVFFRRDLKSGKGVWGSDTEVINFTFDEFRDFLLARHLVGKVWDNNPADFTDLVLELTKKRSPLAEGLARYLFWCGKELKDDELSAALQVMPWYTTIFGECIFSVGDHLVSDDDLRKLQEEFVKGGERTKTIVFRLTERLDRQATPKLNIDLLFQLIDALNDDEYDRLIRPLFEDGLEYSRPNEIAKLATDIGGLAGRQKGKWNSSLEKLMELLVYLFPLQGPRHHYPAFKVFLDVAGEYPERAISLLEAHVDSQLTTVRMRVWEMLTELAACGMAIPNYLILQAQDTLAKAPTQSTRELREMRRLVRLCEPGRIEHGSLTGGRDRFDS